MVKGNNNCLRYFKVLSHKGHSFLSNNKFSEVIFVKTDIILVFISLFSRIQILNFKFRLSKGDICS